MRAVVQRVRSARVSVEGTEVGAIGSGLLVLVAVTHADTVAAARELARKVYGLRILRGELGLADVADPAALVVSQFTLYGDTRKGRRPSWNAAAPGPAARPLVDAVVADLRERGVLVRTGRFGADMALELVNDGPVTVLVET